MAEDFDVEAMLEAAVDKGKRDSYDGPLYRGSGGDGSPRNVDHKDSHERHSKHVRRERSKSRERKRERSRDRDRDIKKEGSSRSNSRDRYRRSRSRDRKRNRRSSRSRSPSRSSRHHSKSSSSRHYRSERHRSRSRSRDRRRENSRERRYHRSITPTKEELPLEERDQRTVFCMQLAARVCQRDIEEFFSKVGKVREVRLIMDNRTRRHKGIAYVEFVDIDSVGKAITLTGTRLCGTPIIVQHSQAEKNRLASVANSTGGTVPSTKPAIPPHIKTKPKPNALNNPMIKPNHHHNPKNPVSGPMGLYVGSLHFNVSEDMLRGIFEPFGKVEKIELARDSETQRSKGYGFVHFSQAEDAKKALEQLNGFELAGRPMKVNYVTERSKDHSHNGPAQLDSDELDRTGIDLGATGRLQLMAKLAEGTGIELPKAAAAALQLRTNNHHNIIANNNNLTSSTTTTVQNGSVSTNQLPIATQCFLLSNMFDPRTETNPNWPEEIKNDVIEECRKHGGIVHIYVDPTSNEGHVYVKCASIMSASASVTALHGRWFAGRLITAAFVPVIHYNNLFPESANATTHL